MSMSITGKRMVMREKNYKKIIAAAFVIIVALVFVYRFTGLKKVNLAMIEDYIKSYGSWSIAAFLVISAIRPLAVFIPVTILTMIAGGLYGPIYGFLLSMLSIIISSNVAFIISRYFGKSFIEKLIKKRADSINLKIEKSGFKVIFIMRISGVFPLDILSYAAGVTKVKYRDFILATILGSAPETFSIAYMGHNIKKPLSPGFFISIALLLTIMGIPMIYKKLHK